jgi:hypothetical protein
VAANRTTAYVCVTCAVQHAPTDGPPARCAICDDERQYVRQGGQAWTTLDELAREHRVELREIDRDIWGVGVSPSLGIGQRALLVRTPQGNVLWDCIGFIDDDAVRAIRVMGGVAAIAVSHPHFYGAIVEWSRAFGASIYLPSADREHVQYPDDRIVWWKGRRELVPGVTVVQCGGHFDGSAVLHWYAGAEGRGALLVGDTITVVPDVRFVSFMRSYPNHIPLPADAVRRIVERVRPLAFTRIYGGWWDRVVREEGHAAVARSAERYLRWIGASAPSGR